MNTAFLLMSSAMMAGAETPTTVPAPAPVMAGPIAGPMWGGGGGCCGSGDVCGVGMAPGCADPNPMEKTGLFGKFRTRRAMKKEEKADCGKSGGLFAGFTTAACDGCGDGKGGLFGRLKGMLGHKSSGHVDACWGGGCGVGGCGVGGYGGFGGGMGGCALPPVPGAVTPTFPAAPPVTMPGGTDTPKEGTRPSDGKGGNGTIRTTPPGLTPIAVPQAPATGTKSPF